MILTCPDLAVPMSIMQHVVNVESSGNPYAIGVVKGKLSRQPRNLSEAIATVKMLESKGFNFSVGIAQVNRYNLKPYGLNSYEQAFQVCPNLKAGTRILKECYDRSKHWGKAFSCYYSGNFVTGYKHGYVQKVTNSMLKGQPKSTTNAIAVIDNRKSIPAQLKKTQQQVALPETKVTSQMQAEKINYSELTNKIGQELWQQNATKQTNALNPPAIATNAEVPSQQPNISPPTPTSISRQSGIAEITPKVYTDSAFVF